MGALSVLELVTLLLIVGVDAVTAGLELPEVGEEADAADAPRVEGANAPSPLDPNEFDLAKRLATLGALGLSPFEIGLAANGIAWGALFSFARKLPRIATGASGPSAGAAVKRLVEEILLERLGGSLREF